MGRRTWIKIFSEKWLRGSIREEPPEIRGIWVDLLALAGDSAYGDEGVIRLAPDCGLTDEQICIILNIPLDLWIKAKDRFIETERISVTEKNEIIILSWAKYQSEYQRQKRYREKEKNDDVTESYNQKLQQKVTNESYNSKLQEKLQGEGEGEGEREEERDIYNNIYRHTYIKSSTKKKKESSKDGEGKIFSVSEINKFPISPKRRDKLKRLLKGWEALRARYTQSSSIPDVLFFTEKELELVKEMFSVWEKEKISIEDFLEKANQQDFLWGYGPNGWVATFNWLVKNWRKVWNGDYLSRGQRGKQ